MGSASMADSLRTAARDRRQSDPELKIASLVERAVRECKDAAVSRGVVRHVVTVNTEDEPVFVNPQVAYTTGLSVFQMQGMDERYVWDKVAAWRKDVVARLRAVMTGCDVDDRGWPYIVITWGY